MMKVVLLVFLSTIYTVYGQLLYTQRCPNLTVMPEFNIDKYLGVWYEQSRTFSAFQNIGQCWSRNYTKSTTPGEYYVKTSFRTFLSPQTVTLRVKKRDGATSNSVLEYATIPLPVVRGNYQVVGTDYESWAVEWECTEAIGIHTEILRIMGRKPSLDTEEYEKARLKAAELNLDVRQLQLVNNGGCLSLSEIVRDVVTRIVSQNTTDTNSTTTSSDIASSTLSTSSLEPVTIDGSTVTSTETVSRKTDEKINAQTDDAVEENEIAKTTN